MEKKSKKKALVISLFIVVLVGIIFFATGLKKTPEKTVERYVNALNKGNGKKAIKYTDIEKDDSYYDNTVENYNELVEDVELKVIVDRAEIQEYGKGIDSDADVYCFMVLEKSGDIHIEYERFFLEKIDGKWLIND